MLNEQESSHPNSQLKFVDTCKSHKITKFIFNNSFESYKSLLMQRDQTKKK